MNRVLNIVSKDLFKYFKSSFRSRGVKNNQFLGPKYLLKNYNGQKCLHTSTLYMESKKPDENVDEIITIKKPFRYVAQALKVLNKMRKIDGDFDEYEFLEGTKQAIVYVSDKLAGGKFEEMKHLLTMNGMESLKNIFNENNPKTSILKIHESEIIVVVPVNVKEETFEESGRKWVYVLVDCCCDGPRIVSCSFCRQYVDDADSSWFINDMEYKK